VSALARWHDLLEDLRETVGSYKAIAAKLDLHENTVLNWRRTGLPDPAQEVKLAALLGRDLSELQAIIDDARTEITLQNVRAARERLARRPLTKVNVAVPPHRDS
jgi:hypothetical protein